MVKITFKCCDNQKFDVEEIVAQKLEKMQTEVEDAGRQIKNIEKVVDAIRVAIFIIHLPDITSESLDKIVEYYKGQNKSSSVEDLVKFDNEFFLNLNSKLLLHINMDAAQLGAKELFDLTNRKLTDVIRHDIIQSKSPVEISKRFNLTDGDVKKLVKVMKEFEVMGDVDILIQTLENAKNKRKI